MRTKPPRIDAEDPVTDLELGHVGADRIDLSGQVAAQNPPPWAPDTSGKAGHERRSFSQRAVGPAHRGCVDPDPDLVGLGNGRFDIFEPEDVRRPVSVVDNGPHGSDSTAHLRRIVSGPHR